VQTAASTAIAASVTLAGSETIIMRKADERMRITWT
jgi:hypothetical protein